MNKKFYIIIIAVLVILNIISWRIWWEGPKPMFNRHIEEGERGSKRRGGGKNFFFNKLQLSDEQKQQFEQNRKTYFKQIEEVKDSMNIVRKEIMMNLKTGNDSILQEALIKEMANYKLKLELLTMDHFKGLRSICTEDQIALFDSMLIKMMEHSPMFKEGGRGRGMHRSGMDDKRHLPQ